MSNPESTSATSFSVIVLDMSQQNDAFNIDGFISLEQAIEYARRRVRSSIEELRKNNQTLEELRSLWAIYGEDVIVLGSSYKISDELDHFLSNPATDEEQNYQAIRPK